MPTENDEFYKSLNETMTYEKSKVASFYDTKPPFGALSNMHVPGEDKLIVGGKAWWTTEALYQALRFPDHPDVQEIIQGQKSPMTAKMKARAHRKEKTRDDWDEVRVELMDWCLRLKMSKWIRHVYRPLRDSGQMPIVEISSRDKFWGAQEYDGEELVGSNVLGKLWMRIRDEVMEHGGFDKQIPASVKTHFAEVPLPRATVTLFGKTLQGGAVDG